MDICDARAYAYVCGKDSFYNAIQLTASGEQRSKATKEREAINKV